jgi:hypothetical protein
MLRNIEVASYFLVCIIVSYATCEEKNSSVLLLLRAVERDVNYAAWFMNGGTRREGPVGDAGGVVDELGVRFEVVTCVTQN